MGFFTKISHSVVMGGSLNFTVGFSVGFSVGSPVACGGDSGGCPKTRSLFSLRLSAKLAPRFHRWFHRVVHRDGPPEKWSGFSAPRRHGFLRELSPSISTADSTGVFWVSCAGVATSRCHFGVSSSWVAHRKLGSICTMRRNEVTKTLGVTFQTLNGGIGGGVGDGGFGLRRLGDFVGRGGDGVAQNCFGRCFDPFRGQK